MQSDGKMVRVVGTWRAALRHVANAQGVFYSNGLIRVEKSPTRCIQRCRIDGPRAIDHAAAHAIVHRRRHRVRRRVHDSQWLWASTVARVVAPTVLVRESARCRYAAGSCDEAAKWWARG